MEYMTDRDKGMISVIVPVYNVKNYLDECVQSIINQTYKNLEIILVDDGSTDGSAEICDRYAASDTRVRVIHKENGGQSSARNIGINIARGEYIGFVDSDDIISLRMFEILHQLCLETQCEISCIRFSTIYNEIDQRNQKGISLDKKPYIFTDKETFHKMLFPEENNAYITQSVCGRLFSREMIREFRFPENEVYEEIMFNTYVLYKAGKMAYLDEKLYFYRIRKGSTTHKKIFDRKLFSDRIPHLREQMAFFDRVGYKDMIILHKAVHYTELLYMSLHNPYREYDDVIQGTLREWKLNSREILTLPIGGFRKLLLYLKMRFPGSVRLYYQIAGK